MLVTKKQFLLFTLMPLHFGAFIYILFRPSNLILNSWLENAHFKPLLLKNHFIKQLSYSLPFSLWAIAFINTILVIWGNRINRNSIYWIVFSLIISPLTELLQLSRFVPGTFDIYDLLFLLLFITAFILLIKHKLKFSM